MTIHYYIVKAKCGHVGRNKYIIIDFPIKASTKKEAASIARQLPRVKHHHKDAILEITEIDYDSYISMKRELRKSPYMRSTNIQQQRTLYPSYYIDRIEEKRKSVVLNRRSIPFKLLRQLIAVSDFDSRDFNEMKSNYLWQNKRFSQN